LRDQRFDRACGNPSGKRTVGAGGGGPTGDRRERAGLKAPEAGVHIRERRHVGIPGERIDASSENLISA
jgi:hypothetical protein